MEESRRLCYVGITRAKNELYLTHATIRMLYGESKYMARSVFLDEIPSELIENVDLSGNSNKVRNIEKFDSSQAYFGQTEQAVSKNDIKFEDLKSGKKLKHKTFGIGVIVSFSKESDDIRLVVAFDNMGIKKLTLSKAPIEFI